MITNLNKLTKAQLIDIINKLEAQCAELHTKYEALRARETEARRTQPNSVVTMTDGFVDSAKATYQERCAEAERHAKASGNKERAIATFFNLKDAGEYIVELKRRGCKRSLFARRNAQNNAFDIFVR